MLESQGIVAEVSHDRDSTYHASVGNVRILIQGINIGTSTIAQISLEIDKNYKIGLFYLRNEYEISSRTAILCKTIKDIKENDKQVLRYTRIG